MSKQAECHGLATQHSNNYKNVSAYQMSDFINERCISVKTEYQFEDYSFSQTTLEQVFIKFAKQQEEVSHSSANWKVSTVQLYS